MDYLKIITQLDKLAQNEVAKNDLILAYKGLQKEKINSLPKEQAEKRFIYYMRPYFIFDLYPSLYNKRKWTGLTFDDYLRGINKALSSRSKEPNYSMQGMVV
ncbi:MULTISPECIES: hypothetical protein [unclassified Enterococcus]|uniref:hypothetical protein n=1 Tax=unclassified Enterococcus TaxID=2608891 RepID=UPI0028FD3485|nr:MULTISPECIES: hypothetical protein [unclassified Enterococcus]MDU0318674.1 hypothetical protein [Enterococcus sp. 2STP]MDU0334049.1 hypothetical protein [Enterococcus sp. 2CBP]MDU0350147.1 hypothetical protein [Enterococcus sp. 3MOLP]